MQGYEFSEYLLSLSDEAEQALESQFKRINKVAFKNTSKVMAAFRDHRVSEAIFAPTTGYGYDDRGRDTLDAIWADVFGTEAVSVTVCPL